MKVIGKRSSERQKIRSSNCLIKDLKERKLKEEDAIDHKRWRKRLRCQTRKFHAADPNGKQLEEEEEYFSELRWGETMAAYTKQQWKKEKSERLRGEREGNQIKFIDLRFERGQAVGFRKKKARCSINCMFLGLVMIWELVE